MSPVAEVWNPNNWMARKSLQFQLLAGLFRLVLLVPQPQNIPNPLSFIISLPSIALGEGKWEVRV